MTPRPAYLDQTLLSRSGGFALSAPPPEGLADPVNLGDADPWKVLGCALERCKAGDFSVFAALYRAMERFDDADFWNSSELLVAYAAPRSQLAGYEALQTEKRLRQSSEWVRRYCETACGAMSLSAARRALCWYAEVADKDHMLRDVAPVYFSILLEAEPAEIEAGPQSKLNPQLPPPFEEYFHDIEEYRARVDEALRRSAQQHREATPIFAGAPFSVVDLAQQILRHTAAGEDSGRTNVERMAFEAATGIPCDDWFAPDPYPLFKLRPLTAAATVQDFLRSPAAEQFSPGVRYFFGRPIPT